MENQEHNQQEQNSQEAVKTYSQEDLDKLLQAETDRKVSKALETAKAKWQSEFEAKLEQEKTEAEKLAKMSESERLQAQFESEKEKFEQERQQFMRERLELETVKELSTRNLPTEFSRFVLGNDAEATKNNLDLFQTQFQQAVEKAVNEKLKGQVPKSSTGTGLEGTMTKEQFNKLGYKDRLALYQSNPDLYNQLQNG
ncbi:DUF4355 domain-containing protein [Cytobacillus kochii]|uniref:DUF4355 domain-containing protein n=1 Tax=Cytobacillus kochii TaxID=859143 RepID=UPI001CD68899|nr:DUF4355 domain-containing protein [Cytobacillus kochii]MCA1025779.1 DUF4355 domain-containing protein [Cytobacillus kochii]